MADFSRKRVPESVFAMRKIPVCVVLHARNAEYLPPKSPRRICNKSEKVIPAFCGFRAVYRGKENAPVICRDLTRGQKLFT